MGNGEDEAKAERCRYCGGKVVGVKEEKNPSSFLNRQRSEKKQCQRCRKILKNHEVTLCSPTEELGWHP